jgi:hypothetical protein
VAGQNIAGGGGAEFLDGISISIAALFPLKTEPPLDPLNRTGFYAEPSRWTKPRFLL